MTRPVLAVLALAVAGCGDRPARPAPGPLPATTFVSGDSDPEEVRAADVSILFVGNSHTSMHDLPGVVGSMVRFGQPTKSVVTHYLGVAFLEDMAQSPAFRTEVETRPWKHVVLQAQKISQSGKHEYSRAEGIDFARLAKGRGMGVVFYPEWGLRGVAGDGPRQEKVYREMAAEAGVGVAPVARAWDLALAERPGLPLHDTDGNHQSQVGAFLTSCVLYGRITGGDPTVLAVYNFPAVGDDDRRFLAGVAARALAEKP